MESAWEKELFRTLSSVRNEDEAKALFKALLTPAEYKELIKRWQIVKLLIKGEPQRFIRDKVSVSIATVTRGAREVKYGSGIFQKIFHRSYPGGK